MEVIKFFHYREINTIYTACKIPFDEREIYLVAWQGWQGKKFIETVAYEVDEFESNFNEGIWIKLVD